MRAAIAIAWVAWAANANASPTVAVMPFADLTSKNGAVGEAIRETVTADLRGVPGLRVVERARLDQVLAENNRDAVRAGKLVGATILVTGGYQRVGGDVRLTARFVDVESGVVLGSAKVDGAAGDLLSLQDRITVELARSAGFAFAPRRRPKLRSLRAVEMYGDALLERDETRRHELLRAAIVEEPQYDYAVRDLDALEQRLQKYAERAEAERQRVGLQRVEALEARVAAARAPAARTTAYAALFDELHAQLRFRRLRDDAGALVDKHDATLGAALDERARWELILGLCLMKSDTDRVLREGEHFLAAYPTSRHFDDVKQFMSYAIRWKRKAESGASTAAARIAALPVERRDDPCVVGHIYHEERVLTRAAENYERCVADPRADKSYLQNLINVYIAMPDFKAARRVVALVRVRFPGMAEGPDGEHWKELPIDAD
jgi:TolB-like protein